MITEWPLTFDDYFSYHAVAICATEDKKSWYLHINEEKLKLSDPNQAEKVKDYFNSLLKV